MRPGAQPKRSASCGSGPFEEWPGPDRQQVESIVATQQEWPGTGGDSPSAAGAQEILSVLCARGIEVTDDARQRIQSQWDPAALERWLERAVVATSIEDVLDDPS
jgi:hypothetical protein